MVEIQRPSNVHLEGTEADMAQCVEGAGDGLYAVVRSDLASLTLFMLVDYGTTEMYIH